MSRTPRSLQGTPVVPGIGWGPAVRPAPRPEAPVTATGADPATEAEHLRAAVQTVIARLHERAELASGAVADVLTTTAAMAGDPELARSAGSLIEQGHSAPRAFWAATNSVIDSFRDAGGLLAERVTDICDIRDRVVAELLDLPEPGVPTPTEPSVLLAEDLAPADAALLNPELIVAIAIRLGGPSSHTAIIARQLGIPCVVGVADLDGVAAGASVLVDGDTGEVTQDPDPVRAEHQLAAARELATAAAAWTGPGQTRDGHPVELLANVQDADGARAAANGVAVGVGLFRTELAFLNSPAEPSPARQERVYRAVFDAFDGRKVVVRTLDAGSDKPMPFITYEDEDNPALGVRGLRIAREDTGILDRQLDAIAAAANGAPTWVMAPMVALASEARFFAERARSRGLVPGVMIEIPAAALGAEAILAEVDFVSLGTNDLAQYTMAADRLSPYLANLCDPWQPAVLTLVHLTAQAGLAAGKPVGLCGEAAADPLLAPVLVGLGVTSLSAAATALPAVGAALAKVDLDTCRRAADTVLAAADAPAARSAARAILAG